MKRKYIIVLVMLIVLVIIGFIYLAITKFDLGKSNLECTSEGNSGGMTIEQKYRILYSKETISNITETKTYIFEDEKKFDNFKSIMDNTLINMQQITNDHVMFSLSTKSQKYITKLDVDVELASDSELTVVGFKRNIDEMKTYLEEQGLTCK